MNTIHSNSAPQMPATGKRLVRSSDRMVGGVAAGVADYVGVDVSIVRLAFVALTVIGGSGPLIYLAGWLVIPDAPVQTPPPPGPSAGATAYSTEAATPAAEAADAPGAPAPSAYVDDTPPA